MNKTRKGTLIDEDLWKLFSELAMTKGIGLEHEEDWGDWWDFWWEGRLHKIEEYNHDFDDVD